MTASKEKRLLSEALLALNEQETCSLRSDKFFLPVYSIHRTVFGWGSPPENAKAGLNEETHLFEMT